MIRFFFLRSIPNLGLFFELNVPAVLPSGRLRSITSFIFDHRDGRAFRRSSGKVLKPLSDIECDQFFKFKHSFWCGVRGALVGMFRENSGWNTI